MKYILCSLLLISILISGCSFDESFEKTQERDGDDINVIQKIGPQSLDQMIQLQHITVDG